MNETITDDKYVELSYEVVDSKNGQVLSTVEFPLGYVHGANKVLSEQVTAELEGKAAGECIEVPIDCNQLYGPRDESLVITDYLNNIPEEYHEVGTRIVMGNEKGETLNFLVTRIDEETLTIDGNNPLCGREVIFKLKVLSVRDATEEEIKAGGKAEDGPDIGNGFALLFQ
jgi:FKBP-type peptidyl-prolyl cis-trans isomerase SlyD